MCSTQGPGAPGAGTGYGRLNCARADSRTCTYVLRVKPRGGHSALRAAAAAIDSSAAKPPPALGVDGWDWCSTPTVLTGRAHDTGTAGPAWPGLLRVRCGSQSITSLQSPAGQVGPARVRRRAALAAGTARRDAEAEAQRPTPKEPSRAVMELCCAPQRVHGGQRVLSQTRPKGPTNHSGQATRK